MKNLTVATGRVPGGELRLHASLRMAAPVRASPDLQFHANCCPSWHEEIGRRLLLISLNYDDFRFNRNAAFSIASNGSRSAKR